ncbi:MAG: hypothetical protein OEY81_01345, partial [Candidatus Bathyarchaeota archaeon]|nr:hypothetical protein [Candidatus Bathyarchaeota archaeon]
IKTVHPEEWPGVRVYLEEELQKSAGTLAGKPLLLDHSMLINGEVTGAEYEDGAIEYVAKVGDPRILDLIKSGVIKHCSVEFEWKSLEHVNGVAPRGITFTGLSLLKNFAPGDPLSTVEVWEAIVKRLKEGMSTAKEQATGEPQEFILYVIRDPAAFLEERFSTAWLDLENGIQAIYGRLREEPENPQPMALLFMKAKSWTLEKMQGWLQDHSQYLRQSQPAAAAPAGIQSVSPTPSTAQGVMKMNKEELEKLVEAKVKAVLKEQQNQEPEKDEHGCIIGRERFDEESQSCVPIPQQQAQEAEWPPEYINDLPDSAFAVIASGGEKDDQGKTVPRTLRKLPHHNAQGNLDLPHLRAALARMNQIEGASQADAKKHLCGHARGEKAEDLVSEFCGEEPAQEQQGNEEPEKDEHGCLIGKETWDSENEKCVPISAEARVAPPEQTSTTESKKKKGLGEAIIPTTASQPNDLISRKEVLALLPERIPRHWGYGPNKVIMNLKRKLKED